MSLGMYIAQILGQGSLYIQKIKHINSTVQLFHIFGHFSLLKVSFSVGCVLKSPIIIKNLSISPCHSIK